MRGTIKLKYIRDNFTYIQLFDLIHAKKKKKKKKKKNSLKHHRTSFCNILSIRRNGVS